MFTEKRSFKNDKGQTLVAVYEGEEKDSPVVVMCHGYGSTKDSDSTKTLARKLTISGISVYRFDFTGCGESDGTLKDLTPQEGLDDLNSAVKNLDKKEFALYGSSFGGYIALEFASKNPVLALALKAPVSDYPSVINLEGNKSDYRTTGFLREAKEINIFRQAKNIKAPTLIVHGSDDDVVPVEHSEKLLIRLGGEKRLSIIHGATHDIEGADLEDVTTQISDFFVKQLL